MMSAKTAEEDLQDLSPADAQELRAFLEKRKWFEAKLKVLENTPPIYPFVHPQLSDTDDASSSSAPVYRDLGNAEWKLPSEDEIRTWSREHAALEEEILAFDGGDLSRMKRKTRAATLLPLTPPSTQLVSITLALIVLVDRLMKLLRQRADLLELTALRLQWDKMRWQIMIETNKVRAEIDAIARGKARWVPPGEESAQRDGKAGLIHSVSGAGGNGSPVNQLSTLPSSTSISSCLSEMSASPLTPSKPVNTLYRTKRDSVSSMASLVQSTNSPRRTFHLPLLHSSIVNLEIRQKNLSSTLLTRSGKLLDKMIDLAIPLKSLGGVEGPKEDQEGGGAVPDDLLDLQDNLESQDADLSLRLAWCKELEEQWKQADAHHLASARAQDASIVLLQELSSALSRPATSSEHQSLSEKLIAARKQSPEPIGAAFPRPSHPSYPEHDDHNDHLVRMLAKTHADADSALREAQAGLEWYHRLALASEKLIECRERVECDLGVLQSEVGVVERGDAAHGRPDLAGSSFDVNCHTWVDQVPSQLSSVHASREKLQESNQRLAVQILRSRQILKSAPLALNDTPDHPAYPILTQAANLSDLASEAVDRAQKAAQAAEQDLAVLPLLRDVLNTASSLRDALKSLEAEAATTEGAPTRESVAVLLDRLRLLGRDYESRVAAPIKAIRNILTEQGRALPTLTGNLAALWNGLGDDISKAQLRIDQLASVMEQSSVVSAIEAEADDYMASIRLVQQAVDAFCQCHPAKETCETGPEGFARDAKTVSHDVGAWVAGLAARVRFIMPFKDGTSARDGLEDEARVSSTALSPSISLPAVGSIAIDTKGPHNAYNAEARRRVNEAAARVQSAASHLCRSTESAVSVRLRGVVVRELDDIDSTLDQIAQSVDDAETRLDSLSNATTSASEAADMAHVINELRDLEDQLDAASRGSEMDHLVSLLDSRIADMDALPSGDQQLLMDVHDDLHKRLSLTSVLRHRLDRLSERLESRIQSTFSSRAPPRENVDHNGAVSARSSPSDVFGAVASISTHGQSEHDSRGASIKELGMRLEQLQLDQILYPSAATLQSTPAYRKLPSSPLAKRIREELDAISLAFGLPRQQRPSEQDAEDDNLTLQSALKTAEEGLTRLDDLVAVSRCVNAADEAFSDLLDLLDEHDAGRVSEIQALANSAAKTVDLVRETSQPVRDDLRVVSEVHRVETAWKELDALVDDVVNPDSASIKSVDSVSDVSSSLGSMTLTAYRRPLTSASSRIASNPIVQPQRASEPRHRATSDTPSRIRVDSMRSGLPRLRKSSMGVQALDTPVQPVPPSPRPRPSSIPRPTRLSAASSLASTTPTVKNGTTTPKARIPSLSSEILGGGSASRSRRAYVADPKSKLDVAVGKIVNKLKVDVPIRPVGLDSGDEWKDQSGKYWIGSEGRAKLCFCRILRSQTVMVRVGGGWVELSKFLLDHFADSLAGWNPATAGLAGIGIGSSTPVPITSASLATPKRPTSSATQLVYSAHKTPKHTSSTPEIGIGRTPVRHVNLSSSSSSTTTRPELSTPQRRPPALPVAATASGASPLLPMHFIRKASESPPVRQKEKEKLAGRRSILGRSPSGNVLLQESPEKEAREGKAVGSVAL